MTRIQLRVYVDPGEAEITLNVQLQDQSYERLTATLDTGATVSLLPIDLLDKTIHRLTAERGTIIIDQAGIAQQSFQATEAYIKIFLEDQFGNRTLPFEIPVWFAQTDIALVGFAGILDQSVLHLDMPQRSGWLEIDK